MSRRHGEMTYDIVIMGGGPAGASLGARLVRGTDLKVAIFEEARFPREHIGESFASPVIPCLQESGALPKVLASNCYVRKFGGYYYWDAVAPTVAFFRHRLWQQDGYHRWSLHVNRAEFDQILLEHARDSGVKVYEGARVETVTRCDHMSQVRINNGQEVLCHVFVDASGRRNHVNPGNRHAWLSSYRNIAIWGHFIGGKPAQSLPGDWNIFREQNLSPIGCFAFSDGWIWYIPVPQSIQGRKMLTHSIGIVTDPSILQKPGRRLTQMNTFLQALKQIPLLKDLIIDIRPVYPALHTARMVEK
jgi:hypothetical protein